MKIKELYQQRDHFFLEISPTTRGGLIFLIALGFATFVCGMVCGEHTRTWGSLIFNGMFFFSLALGGVALSNMQDVIGATWGRPIRRIHENFSSFLPISVVLFLALFVCIKWDLLQAGKIYKWIADPSIVEHLFGKNVWLQPNFMMIRDTLALLLILFFSRWHYKLTTAADKAFLSNQYEKGVHLGEHARKTLRKWSAPVLILYSVLYSILAFDLMMSLAPTWVSTLWAGWQFSVMMQTLFATILLLLFYLKKTPVGHFIGRQQFHDIGKLLFGFTAFYAYLTYAHVLTYWYTNMPEETSYFITRLQGPWLGYIIAAPFISFLVPFVLMVPKAAKWTSYIAIPVCILVLGSQWLNMMLVVIPETADAAHWHFPWIELGLMLGFTGAFALSFLRRAKKLPLLSLGDPLLYQSLSGKH